MKLHTSWFFTAAPSKFGTYRLCEQRRFRRACASAQSRQNFRCSLIQAVTQEEPSDRKPDPWPLWMAWHAQLKFIMTECSKTQIRLTGLRYSHVFLFFEVYPQAARAVHFSNIPPYNPLIYTTLKDTFYTPAYKVWGDILFSGCPSFRLRFRSISWERIDGIWPNLTYALMLTRSRMRCWSVNFHQIVTELWPLMIHHSCQNFVSAQYL